MSSHQLQHVLLDNQRYVFNIAIANSVTTLPIPNGFIQQLIIEDNIYSIFSSGKLIIDSSNDQLDNYKAKEFNELKEMISYDSYKFNYDGYDTVFIDITPVSDEPLINDVFPDDVYKMSYIFTIVDEDENQLTENNGKQKIFYLKDARQQYLEMTNYRWSTADAVLRQLNKDNLNLNLSQSSNSLRKIETGTAIKDIIETCLSDYQSDDQIFAADWSVGATKMFYSSGNGSSPLDDIEFLLDRHVGEMTYDNCILKLKKNNMWVLKSLSDIFRASNNKKGISNGEGLMDVFNLATLNTDGMSNDFIPASPDTSGNPYGEDFDGLTSYNYLNTVSDDTMKEFSSIMVHSYNDYHKQFSIDGKDTNVENIKESFQRLYADKMKGPDPTAIFPDNETKRENRINLNVYGNGYDRYTRLNYGVNRVLSKAMSLSPGINFTTAGSTHRETSRFINLSNKAAEKGSPLSKVLVGDWFVTKINHVFLLTGNQYLNDITCVKPYSSEPLVK